MKRKISISVTEEEYKEISVIAESLNLTVTDYILEKLNLKSRKKLKLNLREVLARLPKIPDKEFSLPELFTKNEWSNYTKGSRLSAGRAFFRAVTKLEKTIKVKFLKKNSANLAIYKTI